MMFTSVIKNGEETMFFEYGFCKAWAKFRNYRWQVQVKFFYPNGQQCGETHDYIYGERERVIACFSEAKLVCDAWRNGKCA